MPNQANFPDPLNGTFFQRPDRLSNKDITLLSPGQQQILFGTSINDNVEVWIYNPDGTFAGHQTIAPTDTALTLTTLVDNSGAYELLNIDMKEISNRIGIAPGRYSLVCNFFRDEVGSEAGYKLYISQISDDRTELQLTPVSASIEYANDAYDWIVPGVPKEYAAGLMMQLFGANLNSSSITSINPLFEPLTINSVAWELDQLVPGTTDRINYASAGTAYTNLVNTIMSESLVRALDLMALDVNNNYIQQRDLDLYIQEALLDVMNAMVSSGRIDPRFELILPTTRVLAGENSNQFIGIL